VTSAAFSSPQVIIASEFLLQENLPRNLPRKGKMGVVYGKNKTI
jgi:hypothetical protein